MDTSKHKITIKWMTQDKGKIQKIRERFGIPSYTTINGWSPAEVSDEDLEILKECERRHLIALLPYTWRKNRVHFAFKYRK